MGEVNIVTAFIAGIVMFLAPCTLPIVPGFIVFISSGEKEKAVRNSILFSLGFTLTFLLFGILAGLLGHLLLPYKVVVQRVGALFIIAFGLYSLGLFNLPILQTGVIQKFFQKFLKKKISPFIFGVSFACGWTPCVGPVLAGIFLYAAFSFTVLQAMFLFLFFSLGFVIPFMLVAFIVKKSAKSLKLKSSKWLSVMAGLILIFLGILLLTDNFNLIIQWSYKLFNFINYQGINDFL